MKSAYSVVITASLMLSLLFPNHSRAADEHRSVNGKQGRNLSDYLNSSQMSDVMYQQGVVQDRHFNLQQNCKDAYKVTLQDIDVFDPLNFSEHESHPIQGVWKVAYRFERCGESKLYNTLFIADENGDFPTARIYFPGSTNADPVLVQDAMYFATVAALSGWGHKDCKEIDLFDMHVNQQPYPVAEEGRAREEIWNETWTFRVCGQMTDVDMTFFPDADRGGTTFAVDSARPQPKLMLGKSLD
jgi:hypothetical protein